MARKKETEPLTFPVPTSCLGAEMVLLKIGDLDRELADLEIQMNEGVSLLKVDFEAQATPLRESGNAMFDALHIWAEANRSTLLKAGQKTIKLASGELSWRTTPPSVSVSKIAVVIEALKIAGLKRFLRTKTEIDKNKILADPDAVKGIKGIKISQREEFVAKPDHSEIEKVQTVTISKKKAS